MMEARIIELESRLAFQELTLAMLNDAVISQRQEIERLALTVTRLFEDVARGALFRPVDPSEEPPPPHY